MRLCQVVGTVWATVSDPCYRGRKVLVVQAFEPESGSAQGARILAVDFVGAGLGDIVLLCEEGSAACSLFGGDVPVVQTLVGIVDRYDLRRTEVVVG